MQRCTRARRRLIVANSEYSPVGLHSGPSAPASNKPLASVTSTKQINTASFTTPRMPDSQRDPRRDQTLSDPGARCRRRNVTSRELFAAGKTTRLEQLTTACKSSSGVTRKIVTHLLPYLHFGSTFSLE